MSIRPALLIALALPILSDVASPQCARWAPGFEGLGGGGASSLAVHDDGSGTALYVGGSAGVVRFDGSAWSTLGEVEGWGYITAIAALDLGDGPELYAGGAFLHIDGVPAARIARWDGATWSPLGAGLDNQTTDFEVFDDGSGPALYVSGTFTTAGGVPANRIARWDGTAWSALPGAPSGILTIETFDDGTGPALYVGGAFATTFGDFANRVARWDGTSWSAVGTGTNGAVFELEALDEGSGPSLYAAGMFTTAGGAPAATLARWDGASWSDAGLSPSEFSTCYYVDVHDDGSGPVLIASGRKSGASVEFGILRRSAGSWSSIGTTNQGMGALASADFGTGPGLIVGGAFQTIDGVDVGKVARWSGGTWSPLSSGDGLDSPVLALAMHDDGVRNALYAGGSFSRAGTTAAARIARFEGGDWHPLAGGVTGPGTVDVRALQSFDDGSGPALYVGGRFGQAGGVAAANVARWRDGAWSDVGGGTNGMVTSFAVWDDGSGPALYAGGAFSTAGGTVAARIARWNGTSWSTVGTFEGFNGFVHALLVHDDGSGLQLYAGGEFSSVDSIDASGIARWNGVAWSAVGAGAGSTFALATFDDGGGPALYAGGLAGAGNDALERWNGVAWSPIPGAGSLFALAVFDDGSGPALYGGEDLHLRRWNASGWTTVGSVNEQIRAFVLDPEIAALYVGGDFTAAGGLPSEHLARWERCATEPIAFCFGDGTGAACPCGNVGLPGHGCRNSATIRGAELTASGTNVPDALVLRSEFEPATALSIFLQGNVELASPALFGDGLRCVGGALKRLYVTNAVGGITSAPATGDPSITERSAALGDPIAPGSTRSYQVYYRDPEPTWCPAPAGSTFNVSNGLRVVW